MLLFGERFSKFLRNTAITNVAPEDYLTILISRFALFDDLFMLLTTGQVLKLQLQRCTMQRMFFGTTVRFQETVN